MILIVAACEGPGEDGSGGSGDGSGTAADTTVGTSPETTAATMPVDDGNCGMHVLDTLEEDCEGIGSTQSILGPAMVAVAEELSWAEVAGDEITHAPAEGTTPVSVELRYDGGELRCFHYCNPCPGQPCGAPDQPARIEADAIVDISSDDGALAESVEVVATGGDFGMQVSYTGALAPGAIQGTLTVELLDASFEDLSVSISGLVSDGSTSGALFAGARQPAPNGPAVSTPVASWPAL